MTTNSRRLAIAAALAAAIAVAAFAAIGSIQPPTESPSPAPTATAAAAPSQSTLASALLHRWNGPTRTISDMSPPALTAVVILEGRRMTFDAGGAAWPNLGSIAGSIGPGQLEFKLLGDAAGCRAGDVGTYTFTLSPGGGFLTLQPTTDPCQARSDALTGAWERSDCPNRGGWCLGDIEAGEHQSAAFNPFLTFDARAFDYGKLSYTVPDGWANPEEDATLYVIAKQAQGEDASIWLLSDETAHVQRGPCPENEVDPTVGGSPDELAAWLGSLAGLSASAPKPVTIGGLSGVQLDLAVDAATARTCPGATEPSVQVFADSDGREHDVSVHGDVPMRVYLLDLGDGRSLVIFINGVDKATYEALLPQAESVIESFTFNR
jgi:hypothetical protein